MSDIENTKYKIITVAEFLPDNERTAQIMKKKMEEEEQKR